MKCPLDRTAPASREVEAVPTKSNVPGLCRDCPLRHQPCGYYPEECEAMTEAELARRPKDQMDAMAWALDRVFDYPKREEATHGRC